MKNLVLFILVICSVGCKTTVSEYNTPRSFAQTSNSIELWMNDDGANSAVILSVNGQEAWQQKAMQGSAMSVVLPSGVNQLAIRMNYQEFMEFPFEKVINLNPEFESGFKYVFVSQYNKDANSFSYRFEKIDENSVCKYGPTNFKRIITGQLSCSNAGVVYEFTL